MSILWYLYVDLRSEVELFACEGWNKTRENPFILYLFSHLSRMGSMKTTSFLKLLEV